MSLPFQPFDHHVDILTHIFFWMALKKSPDGVWGRPAEGRSLSTDKLKTRANICDSRLLRSEAFLFFGCALRPSSLVTPFTRFSLLSLANSSPRDRLIDKCATITSTRTNTPAWISERADSAQDEAKKSHIGTEDWQTGRESATLQWLPVTTFDWQLVGPSSYSSSRSLIMKQWRTTSGQMAAKRSSIKLPTGSVHLHAWPWHLDAKCTD